MRMRERGIGNLPFIGVLVLFVVAIALWFVAKSEADDNLARAKDAEKDSREIYGKITKLADSYNTLVDVVGVDAADLSAKDEVAPDGETIKETLKKYLMARVAEMKKRGEATLDTLNYQVQPTENVIVDVEGEKTKVTLYGTHMSEETITFRSVLDPLGDILNFAAKVMMDNNRKFHEEFGRYKNWKTQLQNQINSNDEAYKSDVQEKQRQAEGWKNDLDETRAALEAAQQKIDSYEVSISQLRQQHAKEKRLLERELQAWKTRAINEKIRKELALKEDPKDGTVIAASRTRGTVYIGLGRRQRVSRGTKFQVWRPGKGNVREDIAVIRVIDVGETSSEARIVEQINPRVPVTKGMNVSNPFFDPTRQLKAYIYGDLKRYNTDVAARRLAAAGVIVANRLDDTVNVIILGEPPVAIDQEFPEDEFEAVAAEKRRAMERDKRLEEIMRIAVSIQALVVTEDALATFIDY